MDNAIWLWLPGFGLIIYALWLGEGDYLSVAAAVCQFPLLAIGFAALLVCVQSDRLPFRRVRVPGAAFIASIAYSAYLVQKLAIHFVSELFRAHDVDLLSAAALIGVEVCVYVTATGLFLAVERPFLQLRRRIAPHSRA